jgi:hypothetical protein
MAGLVGCGGLLKDLNISWLKGYSRKIGSCDALYAEMWGKYLEMNILVWRREKLFISMLKVILKCWLIWLPELNSMKHPLTLMLHIRYFFALNWQVILSSIWHKGNRNADWLTNF